MSQQPTQSKQVAKLDKWKVIRTTNGSMALVGIVSEHPKMPNGRIVQTSKVINLNIGNRVAETKNTIYNLGDQAPEGATTMVPEHVPEQDT